jgi:hypothetical protein
VLAGPTGIFAGAHTVAVQLSPISDRVLFIDLQYPVDAVVEELVASITAEFGPPLETASSLRWNDGTTTISVQWGSSEPTRVQFMDLRMGM